MGRTVRRDDLLRPPERIEKVVLRLLVTVTPLRYRRGPTAAVVARRALDEGATWHLLPFDLYPAQLVVDVLLLIEERHAAVGFLGEYDLGLRSAVGRYVLDAGPAAIAGLYVG